MADKKRKSGKAAKLAKVTADIEKLETQISEMEESIELKTIEVELLKQMKEIYQ